MPGELTEDQRALVNRLKGEMDHAEKWRQQFVRRWAHHYAQYRSYQSFREAWDGAKDRRDRDDILNDGKREWGADLFIPWTFWTIETILPRVISNRPRGALLPDEFAAERNVSNMRFLIERQQEQVSYELIGQRTAKSGLTYGLGWQKSRWRYEERETFRLEEMTLPEGGKKFQRTGPHKVVMFDDPDAVDCDVFDVFWDPAAAEVQACRWINHRVWRTTEYILSMLAPRANEQPAFWGEVPWLGREDVESSGGEEKFDETWADRMRAQGIDTQRRGRELHEVWEWHTPTELVILLDRKWPVYVGPNPAWHGRLPFHAYRPTFVNNEIVGIGEPEQIEHLQAEMNTLRSQRRDNATLKLMQSFAYDMGRVDPTNIKVGPGMLTGVNGDPSTVLHPLTVGDIPFSSYREEENLAADIERVTGISDTVTGAATAGGTATEAQLTVSQANIRLQNKTRLLEVEVIAGVIGDWIDLNQQHIVQERTIRTPHTPGPAEPAWRVWAWRKMGPAQLAGRMVYTVDGGSTGPQNVQEKRQLAQLMLTAMPQIGSFVDPRKWVEQVLELIGFTRPEELMAPDPRLPPEVLDVIGEMLMAVGVPQEEAQAMLSQAVQDGMARAEEAAEMERAGLPPGGGGGGPQSEAPQPPEQAAA